MPFQLENLNPSVRYDYGETEWVEFRLVSEEKMTEIRSEVGLQAKQKYIPNPNTKKMESVNDFNLDDKAMQKFNDLILCYQISDWHLETNEGDLIPCTDENKKKLVYGSPIFAKWVNDRLKDLSKTLKDVEEEEEKN